MPDLIVHTTDGRRNLLHNVDPNWMEQLTKWTPDDFICGAPGDPVVRVGAIASIDEKEADIS